MLELVDQLDNLLQRSIRVPGSRILVDEAALRRLIEGLRAAAPDEVKLGQRIASERERILADARAQARRMVEEAQAQLNIRLDEQAMVQAARQRAREIQTEAEQRATALKTDANQYVSGQLGSLETRLLRLLREVQAGQRMLQAERSGGSETGAQS
jgi:cell division septum initiation protein DivIVA